MSPQVLAMRLRYVLVYAVLMAATAFVPQWRAMDWHLSGVLNQNAAPAWPDNLMLVDVDYDSTQADPSAFRLQLASLLNAVAQNPAHRPKLVMLDAYLAADPRGVEPLT